MQVVKQRLYEKQKNKLVSRHILTRQQIDEAEELFKTDPLHHKLRPHNITCKKDKRRRSISIPNTAYRILYTDGGEKAIFQQILDHDDYNRINKDC